jgi:hypothetical protein
MLSELTSTVDSPRSTKDSAAIADDHGPPWPLIVLLGATAGLVVMNIYYNQPILNAIAGSLSIRSSPVAWVSTATQLGYAAGLLFVLPIGDGVDRKGLIAFTTLLSSGALIAVPFSTNLPALLLSSFAVGAISVTPQLVVPYAAGLAAGPRARKSNRVRHERIAHRHPAVAECKRIYREPALVAHGLLAGRRCYAVAAWDTMDHAPLAARSRSHLLWTSPELFTALIQF